MKFPLTKLLTVLALGTMCLSLSAQQTDTTSKSADDNKVNTDKTDPIFTGDSERRIHAGDYNAPQGLFHDYSPTLPMPQPLYLGNLNKAAIDEAKRQENWTLLTPEQILGIKTPNEILGLADKKNKDQNLSVEDEYLLRLQNGGTSGMTNGRASNYGWANNDDNNNQTGPSRDNANPFDNNNSFNRWNNSDSQSSPNRMANAQQPGQVASWSQYFNQLNSSADNQQGSGSLWNSGFSQPTQVKATTQDQLDAMERFRTMMQPSVSADKIASQTRYPTGTKSDSSSASFFQQQPQYNSAGASVSLLQDSSAKPTGLQPVPSINSPILKDETTKPSWQPQLPPWMRKGPQPR